jgi:hypothetical protein
MRFRQTAGRICIHKLDAIAARPFGFVESPVGFMKQLFDSPRAPFVTEQHAQADGQRNWTSGGLHRALRDGIPDLFRTGQGKSRVAIV